MKTGKLAPRGNFDVAPVPALTNPLGPPSPQRQQSYREHLENLLEQWEAEGGNPVAADLETEQEDPEKELFSHACATCRGKCCQPGGTHAFHDIVTIRRWFAVNPEAGVQQCMQDFLSRLAPISYSGSCVFHGPGGCELPRAMRSDTCNTWLCTELVDLQSSRPERSRQITLIIASDRNIVHRISVVNTRSGEKLETLDCEDLPIRHTKND